MLTPRQSYSNCDALLSRVAPTRHLVDSDLFYQRAEEAGVINLGKNARERLSNSRFLTPAYSTMQQFKLRGQQARAVSDRIELLSRTLRLPALSERDNNALFSSLAVSLDWTMGAARRIAAPINQVRNFMASQLEQQARINAHFHTANLMARLRSLNTARDYGWSQADMSEIAYRLIEIGSLDRRMAELSPTSMVLADSAAKLTVLDNYLASEFGITGAVYDDLLQLGTNVTYAFDDVNRIARAAGVAVDTLDGLGWIHRQYTRPMVKFLQQLSPDTLFQSALDAGRITLNSLLQASRRTNLFLVQDKVALAQILGLTPANHIFVPQTTKVFDIPMKAVSTITTSDVRKTTQAGFTNWLAANPSLSIHQTKFKTWSDLKADILKQTGAASYSTSLLNNYTSADYVTFSNDTDVFIVHTPRASGVYNLQNTFQWGAGRATSLTDFYYINPAYNAPVIRSSKPAYKVIAAQVRKTFTGTPSDKIVKRALNAAVKAGDEATVFSIAQARMLEDGLVIQDINTGGYLAFNISGRPDFFVRTGMHQVDALFDPAFAYGLLDLLRDYTGSSTNSLMDTLVDTGVLAKIPMSSDEFFEYFVQKYRLPFTRPSDVINMNFDEVWLDAANKLKQAVGASMVLTKILGDEGYTAGWLIPNVDYRANPTRYSDYIRVGENKSLVESLVNIGMEPRLREIENSYIHPMVARQIDTLIKVTSSPTHMAQIGAVLVNTLKTYQKLLLTVIGPAKYILNQTLDPLINSIANGGAIHGVPVRLNDLFQFLHNGNLNHLDDTIPIYQHPDYAENGVTLTQRQATKLFLDNYLHGFGSGAVDIEMGGLGNPVQALFDTASLAWQMVRWATFDAGDGRPLKTLAKLGEALAITGEEAITKLFSPQAFLATLSDKSIQLNHFLGRLRPINNADSEAVFRRGVSFGFFDGYTTSSTQLWEDMERTFINPYNAGKVTKTLSRIGMPMFAVYVLKTPFNVMRMVAARPVQFYNFTRMWSIMSAAQETGTNQQDMEFAPYQQHSHVIGEYLNPVGNRERMLLYDTFNNLFNTLDAFGDINAGLRNDYTIHRIEDIAGLGESFGAEIIRKIAGMSQPLIKLAYTTATGINPRTGVPYSDELLGKRPSFMFWQTDPGLRDALYELIPFARVVDNWNPGSVFGTAPVTDEYGNVIIDGKLGWNQVERYPLRNADRIKLSDPKGYNFMYRALTATGFSIVITDADANVMSNLRKLDRTVLKLEQQSNEFAKEVTLNTTSYSPDERDRRLQQWQEMNSLIMLLKLEQLKWQYYMNQYGGKLTPSQINDANSKIYDTLRRNGDHPLVQQYHDLMRVHTEQYLEFERMLLNGKETQ